VSELLSDSVGLGEGGGCLCFCNEHRDECPSHGNPTAPGFWKPVKEKGTMNSLPEDGVERLPGF
jgi:hypothetical protein